MAEDRSEITRNFAPPLTKKDLLVSAPEEQEKKGGLFSKLGGGNEKLPPEEVHKKTQELFDLLVDRVEIKIDIARQAEKSGNQSTGQTKDLSLQERLDLIKKGNLSAAIKSLSTENPKERTLESDLAALRETEQKISELTKNNQVVEEYSKFREKRVEKLRQAREVTDGLAAIRLLNLQQEKMARVAFLDNRQYSPGERKIIDDNRVLIKAISEKIDSLKKDPEVFDMVRIRQLEAFQRGLKKDRFAETPSREKYIDTVRSYWARGKKVLLTGPTGGGKTELLLHASRSLFGKDAERLTGHELMTNYEVYGKTKGGVQDGKVTLMFGAAPFIRALERNVPFVFDEINLVPNKILMRLKTDLNARFGSKVTIQEDSDKEVVVGDKFALGATENVKSEKHVEREKLDPALVRMFESLPIDYFPPNELYDIMLASLMDVRGGIKLSVKDANETLKALCDATEWIQKAYLGQTVQTAGGQILEARGQGSLGKSATLREAVLDPGKALDMLVGWEDAEKSGLTFKEFLNQRILAFINNENFPEEDRYYLTEIFALQGFLRGVSVSEIRVSGLDQATLDAWSGYDGKRYVPKTNYTDPEIVAKLDPYGRLKRPVSVDAGDLLDEEEAVEVVEEEDVDIDSSVATTAQNQTTKQTTAQPKSASGIANSSLSSEVRRALEIFEIQNPTPKVLEYASDIETHISRIQNLVDSYPDLAIAGIGKILDLAQDFPDYLQLTYLRQVQNFARIYGKDPKIKQKLKEIVVKVDSFSKWKKGSNANAVIPILNDLEK